VFTLSPRRWRKNSTRVYELLELQHLLVGQAIHLLLNLFRERVGAGPRRFHDAHLGRVKLLHNFFDRHICEVLRMEHEAVVLIQLREAEARLIVRVKLLRILEEGEEGRRDDALRAKARIVQTSPMDRTSVATSFRPTIDEFQHLVTAATSPTNAASVTQLLFCQSY